MRRLTSFSIVLVVVLQAISLCAQSTGKSEPWFSLEIAEWRHDSFGPGVHRVRVIVKNVSNEDHHLEGCSVSRGYYKISVAYNGVQLEEEKGAAERHLNEAKMRREYCSSSSTSDKFPPGGSTDDYLVVSGPNKYDMSRPGTYEITVSRETLPDDLTNSVTVKSNTITITVLPPDSPAENAK